VSAKLLVDLQSCLVSSEKQLRNHVIESKVSFEANHAVPVIADAYLKGFRGFDAEKAFKAISRSLTTKHPKSDILFIYSDLRAQNKVDVCISHLVL